MQRIGRKGIAAFMFIRFKRTSGETGPRGRWAGQFMLKLYMTFLRICVRSVPCVLGMLHNNPLRKGLL